MTPEKKAALRRAAMALPLQPGVYLMKDATGRIIYIGKAKALRNRVSQYFGSDTNHTEKVRRMVSLVDHFEYLVADSEFEALVLECSLIKQYTPKYNILLKDDKGYSYIRISPPPFSRITEAKQQADDGARYLGPYMSAYVAKSAVDEVNKLFELSTCRKALRAGHRVERPCLNHHIGQCCAPCTGRISEAEYAERVEQAVLYLTQGGGKLVSDLKARMTAAADALDFETAARLRDRLRAVERLNGKQKVVHSRVPRQDVIATAQTPEWLCFEVFRFVGGALSDREEFLLEAVDDLPSARAEFLRRYYTMRDRIPPRIVLDGACEDEELLCRWLTEKAAAEGARFHVRFTVPQMGESAALVAMCRDNAAERIARQLHAGGHEIAALEELRTLLNLSDLPHRIESYDISHTAGNDVVGGMAVFADGRPKKSDYRRFTIKTVEGQDDCACLCEVIRRRLEEYRAAPGSEGFGQLPDLILLDGGAGQLAAVKPLVDGFGYGIPVFGMVKDNHHRTRAITATGGEIEIHGKRAAFTLVSSLQEEVHRYAIAYHRSKRARHTVGTTLTEIDGIGKQRAALLLRRFGSLTAIRSASVEQLAAVKGMTQPAAEAIFAYFHEEKPLQNRD